MNKEVQVYIHNLRKYLTSSESARELLLSRQMDLDSFLEEVTKVAIKNTEEGKDPQLTRTQYEQVRKSLTIKDPSFIELIDGYPPFFLN